MVIWAWVGALMIGLSLGLLGSGGSILTVPVLVYFIGEPGKLAIAESLGIVALISMVGAIPYTLKRQVDWRSVLYFGVPGMLGSYTGAHLSRAIPGTIQLLIFASVMLVAAVMMFRNPEHKASGHAERQHPWVIVAEGLAVGMLAGVVGVGGGFLIVPALVLFGGLPMSLAVGTSLWIIALQSITGFAKYIGVMAELGLAMHWGLILLVGAVGIVGSLLGRVLGQRIAPEHLKRGFAVFLVGMGAFILWQNAGTMLH